MKRSQRRHATASHARPQQGTPQIVQEMFAEAVQHHQFGRLSEAEGLYRRILEITPTYVTALNNLGLIVAPAEAMGLFQKAVACNPDYADAHVNLGAALHAEDNIDQAITHYRKALTLQPNRPNVLLVLGTLLHGQGKLREAATAFQRALAFKPDYVEACLNLGAILRVEGKISEAITHYQRALSLAPDQPTVYLILTSLFLAQGNSDEAIATYQRVIAAHPDYTDAYVGLGITLRTLHKPSEAIAPYQKALALQPENPDALFGLGAILQDQGKLDEALSHYQRVLALQPTHPEVLFATASALHGQGKTDEAIPLYQQVLALSPEHVNANNNLGAALYSRGKVQEAFAHYQQVLRADPNCAEVHNNLGDILKDQKKLDEAAESYQRALRLKPDFTTAITNLGIVYSMDSKFEPAEGLFRRALAVDQNLDVANMNLASLVERDGRLQEAQIYRGRALRPQPLVIEKAPKHRRNVLVLSAAGDGNVPIDTLIPIEVNTRIKWSVECATDAQEAGLPPYDVIFNAIGNADLIPPSLPRINNFIQKRQQVVLNPPERIIPTRRDLMPKLLAGIPNVVAPPVARLSRQEIAAGNLTTRLALAGISYPVIVRPISGQGGLGVVLVETPEQLLALPFAGADVFYFISYCDYQSSDGFYRKYRTIFVDRKLYPYHLAISPRWLVHYFSSEMLAVPWKHDEERRFLETPEVALGPVAMAAVEAICQRMDMDYAGIDFSILADGRILVFEANATMSAVLPDAGEFPYKQKHVRAIFAAFDAMLERHRIVPAQP